MRKFRMDKPLAALIAALLFGGCMLFASAAFGMLARGSAGITSVVFSHLVLGVGGGLVLLFAALTIEYRRWRPLAPYLYAAALFATALVFVPHIGAAHLGGQRWLNLGPLSLQPSEGLKIAAIIMAAAYFSTIRDATQTLTWGAGGLLGILILPVLLLVAQPDIGTLLVVLSSVTAVYFAAGGRWRDIAILLCVAALGAGALLMYKPYLRDRVTTFLDPSRGQQAESYQIKQSLIAIGSGGVFGRGFGQGVQKFTYLPEPMGDSIFAVAGEELGFVGASLIVILFLLFALRGYGVAGKATDLFGGLLAVGISTYLASEAFINIAAMLSVAPLTGIPLTFISQGGSAMLMSLASAGILLSVSRHQKRS
jgi:cell division protein FtsW